MTQDVIIEMLEKEPFEPFRLCLSSGESYKVFNPHLLALGRTRLYHALPDSDRGVMISYLHISALETIGNGHGRKRKNGKGRRPS